MLLILPGDLGEIGVGEREDLGDCVERSDLGDFGECCGLAVDFSFSLVKPGRRIWFALMYEATCTYTVIYFTTKTGRRTN